MSHLSFVNFMFCFFVQRTRWMCGSLILSGAKLAVPPLIRVNSLLLPSYSPMAPLAAEARPRSSSSSSSWSPISSLYVWCTAWVFTHFFLASCLSVLANFIRIFVCFYGQFPSFHFFCVLFYFFLEHFDDEGTLVIFLRREGGFSFPKVAEKCKVSTSSAEGISEEPLIRKRAKPITYRTSGRPRKISSHIEHMFKRNLFKMRSTVVAVTVKK